MSIFELPFIVLAFGAIATLLYAAVATVRGSGRQGARILRRLAVCAAAYFAAVVLVAAISARKVVQVGEPQCFDDWCITVVAVTRPVAHADSAWHVWLRLSSRAQRVTQRELNGVVYLTDDRNRRFDPLHDPSAVPLDTRVEPGKSVTAWCAIAVVHAPRVAQFTSLSGATRSPRRPGLQWSNVEGPSANRRRTSQNEATGSRSRYRGLAASE